MKFFSAISKMATATFPLLMVLPITASATNRPPQLVLLAYDGSKENAMWEKTRSWGNSTNAKLTYFISGVYFLTNENRAHYQAPAGKGQGRSDIGFGGTQHDLELRLDQVLKAKSEGHEIASHANGHFDGSKWSARDWGHEFSEFNRLLTDVHQNNNISSSVAPRWNNEIENAFVGFRAPLLGASAGLWETLRNYKYAYDTSRVGPAQNWPNKTAQGFWNFPLATLTIAGTAKKTLSMDYNFYFADSKGKPDPANSGLYEERMYKTYINYFTKNYYGNRAPIHIGHHFSRWNGGAYLRAFERFGNDVCSLPEVKCVTYQELAQFLDRQSPETIARWQQGQFDRFELKPIAEIDTGSQEINLKVAGQHTDNVDVTLSGSDAKQALAKGYNLDFQVNGKTTPVRMTVSNNQQKVQVNVASLWKGKPFVLSASLRDRNNVEIQRAEHMVVFTDTGFSVLPTDMDEAMRLQSDPPEAHAED